MAHGAKLSTLAERLVFSFTKLDPEQNASEFKRYRELTLKGLRTSAHVRVNQFDVRARLQGLVEKFAVLNREPLSDALQARLEELPNRQGKWTPEILSLLLDLSDRPLENARLDELEWLKPATPPPQLTWEHIVRDDPFDDDEIWNDVPHEAHSSADEADFRTDDSGDTTFTAATSVDESDALGLARSRLSTIDTFGLSEHESDCTRLEILQSERERITITDLYAIRESLLMLRGLPTRLYTLDESKHVHIRENFGISTSAASTAAGALREFAKTGTTLNSLRRYVDSQRIVAFEQTGQYSIQILLSKFDSQLIDVERRYLDRFNNVIVSIIDVLYQTQNMSRTLVRLSAVLNNEGVKNSLATPFALLNGLYEQTCTAQLSGDTEVFESLLALLLESVNTWLRPAARWMNDGVLEDRYCHFFVEEATTNLELGSLWHDQHKIRLLADGSPSAPHLAHSVISVIFRRGKSMVFLRALGVDCELDGSPSTDRKLLDYSELRAKLSSDSLLPFSELFHRTLSDWVYRSGSHASLILRAKLFEDFKFMGTLDAHEYIYFARDGRLFQSFADTLFQRMDAGGNAWRDRFLLTELIQSVFGAASCVDADSLSARVGGPTRNKGEKASELDAFNGLSVNYPTPWPLQNITRESSPLVHQRALIFLLQIYRARHMLQRLFFNFRYLGPRANHSGYAAALSLHHRLLWFVDVMQAYLTSTASNSTAEVRDKLVSAPDIDAMAAVYAEHRSRLESRLLLTKNLKPIREAVTSVLELCVDFGRAWTFMYTGANATAYRQKLLANEAESFGTEDVESSRHRTVSSSLKTNAQSIRELGRELERLVPFITAGLRGVSRAGGEMAWQALAERLEWHGR